MNRFSFAATPQIHFGPGERAKIPELLSPHGNRILLVTGSASFDRSEKCRSLLQTLQQSFLIERIKVSEEPSPSLVDDAVETYRPFEPDAVLAIGGGSVIDAAKAIAGLLPLGHSVMDYLEGVGRGKIYPGTALPWIAVPTTAGTGGETSKNAVLTVHGDGGFKKSFRHEKLVATAVINDPELHLSCPRHLTAACGLDAFTQLLESYVSIGASPMTDALAESGLRAFGRSFMHAVLDGNNLEARADMAYAAMLSGITLANAGLGCVHGLASPLGAFFAIPHGIVCGTLVNEATRVNIRNLRQAVPNHPSLVKYAEAGRILVDNPDLDDEEAWEALLDLLDRWVIELDMPRLSSYGVHEADLPRIVAHSRGHSMQTNPITLDDETLMEILSLRL